MRTKKEGHQSIVHISVARRLGSSATAQTEPPCEVVPMMASEVPEQNRALLVEADIRADMNAGDPMGWALRKANYVIETARSAFSQDEALDSVLCSAIDAVRDYGEESGAELLRKAYLLHGARQPVRARLSEAVGRIGRQEDFDIIIGCLRIDISAPSGHLRALSEFAGRHPHQAAEIHAALSGIADPGEHVLKYLETFAVRRG